ncbi:MAG: fumarate hydratase class II [Bacteriovoracaceae bacterium]|jgi:fumarate hydratase class II
MNITAISSIIGYDQSAELLKKSKANKTSLNEEIIKSGLILEEELRIKLDPKGLVHPPVLVSIKKKRD